MGQGSSFAVVIPAPLGSTRLPPKVLLRDTGKYLVRHVCERLKGLTEAQVLLIATDWPEVEAACLSFGAEVRMTRPGHRSGTDRVAEVARALPVQVVVNVQGHQPAIGPEDVRASVRAFGEDPEAAMATLARRRSEAEGTPNPNVVKVVTERQGNALHFSRSPIPSSAGPATPWLRHVGVHAYRRSFLLKLTGNAGTGQ